jgi:Fur family transcriptional regulator, ferric uptake regulator
MSISEHEVLEQLSNQGFRLTQARRAIIRVLLDETGHLSPEELLRLARQTFPNVGLVTVYRTLELLSDLGYVRRVHSDHGCSGFAKVARGHRHHLICKACGRVVDFEGCDLSAMVRRVEQETGFMVDDHMLELSGMCAACLAKSPIPVRDE